tara:strand:- start:95 stop:292 length:198 start_codon:yes stop_codon:yes gene_type:complete
MNKENYKLTSVRLPFDAWRKFKAICALENVSVSQRLQELVETVINEYNEVSAQELSVNLNQDAEA